MSSIKLNWVLPNVTSKIWAKSIWPMVCTLNNCFCRQKAEMNFTQSMSFSEGLYATHSSALPAAVMKPV